MHISKYITKKASSLSNRLKHCKNSLSSNESTGRQAMNRSVNSRFATLSKGRQTMSLSNGFTIVELLVVIVVIGILAAITIVSYTGLTSRARLASVQSDLSTNATQLKVYQALYGSFPATLVNNCPTAPVADATRCLKISSDNELAYVPATGTSPQDFRLTISDSTNVTNYSTNANNIKCPLNFVIVPGSITYGTSDFCVMKYEAKQVGATTTPISTAAGLPWVSISQTTAIANSPNVASCNNCHLITEAEWMTITQNVLSVASNWSSGTVGTGYIYSGHNDNNPANALEASPDDTLGYTGTGNASGNQRRTLTLTNGEVIWDMAGNVYDWTSGTAQTPVVQPGITSAGYAWREWTAIANTGTLPISPSPTGTGLTNASTWNSANGIGQIYSSSDEVGLRGFIRGGVWNNGSNAGVLYLSLNNAPSDALTSLGFRVAASSGL